MKPHWLRCQVSDIAAPKRNALVGGPFGSDLVSKDYTDDGIPVIRGQNMGLGRWVTGDFTYVSQVKASALAANTARANDIIFTQRGTLGQVAIIPPSAYDEYIISQSQMKLTVDTAKADPLFVYYTFTSPEQQDYIHNHAIQAGVPHTNLGILRETPLVLPPLPEQRAIAHILGTLDDKIEVNRRMNETLEGIARAIFRSWFVGFDPVRAKAAGREPEGMDAGTAALFPEGFDALDSLPTGWETRPIGDAVTVLGGSTPSTDNSAYWGGEIAFATPRDMSALASPVLLATDRRITEEGLSQISSGLLPSGTVIMSSRAPIGYLAIAALPVVVNQGIIAMICDKHLPNYYVLLWAQQNMDTIVGHANGTTFPEISKRNFRPLSVIVPPPTILSRYSEIVGPLYEKITANLRQNESLADLRDSLLPKLLSGELRVGDALLAEATP